MINKLARPCAPTLAQPRDEEFDHATRLVAGFVVEIVSPGSEAMDSVTKVREYASAGIPQYWVVDRDGAQTVTLHRLSGDGTYEARARMPLAWLLQTAPADHLD
ncbi:Uma2 family endonuclease [Micromonospora sp. NPDC005710]|uniref:Uma2 family endonuclease n=1 Tax=Micromonospora sp. NPDC005710 TaxID=3157051 RepID=UPI0033E43BB5